MNHVKKAQDQEYKLYHSNTVTTTARTSGPPPAPLLVCRTDTTMVFKPAPYKPTQKVSCHTINTNDQVRREGKRGMKKQNVDPSLDYQEADYQANSSVCG